MDLFSPSITVETIHSRSIIVTNLFRKSLGIFLLFMFTKLLEYLLMFMCLGSEGRILFESEALRFVQQQLSNGDYNYRVSESALVLSL